MVTEDYCSEEIVELLKKKGFGEVDGKVTHQTAMKWLRDKHGILISIGNDFRDYNWRLVNLWRRNEDGDPTVMSGLYACYHRYEKAIDAALKETISGL